MKQKYSMEVVWERRIPVSVVANSKSEAEELITTQQCDCGDEFSSEWRVEHVKAEDLPSEH